MHRNWTVKKEVPNRSGNFLWKKPRAAPKHLVFWERLEGKRGLEGKLFPHT